MPGDPLPALLEALRPTLISQISTRVHTEIPDYQNVPLEIVTERYAAIVDALIKSLATHEPSHFTNYVERIGRTRMNQGYTINGLLTAAAIVQDVALQTIPPALAADPEAQASMVRRITSLLHFARLVLGRQHLDTVVHPDPSHPGRA
ncbi:MAG TPA: hypothetical protein VKY74_15605 [Chloroflexia bacterium]|nr:hypothetical protein [Chloroflexia bacterium]